MSNRRRVEQGEAEEGEADGLAGHGARSCGYAVPMAALATSPINQGEQIPLDLEPQLRLDVHDRRGGKTEYGSTHGKISTGTRRIRCRGPHPGECRYPVTRDGAGNRLTSGLQRPRAVGPLASSLDRTRPGSYAASTLPRGLTAMATPPPQGVTGLLQAWGGGDAAALDQLVPIVYEELRRQARRYLRREDAGHTLQTTALVHEAYLRLVDQRQAHWQSRAQFFGVAAQAMRRILVDYARRHQAAKRGGSAIQVPFEEGAVAEAGSDVDLVALDDALTRLAALDTQQASGGGAALLHGARDRGGGGGAGHLASDREARVGDGPSLAQARGGESLRWR